MCRVTPVLALLLSPLLAMAFDAQETPPVQVENKLVRVLIQTEKGDIEVERDAGKAPITVANFLRKDGNQCRIAP